MIAGPYTGHSKNKSDWDNNHQILNEYAYKVFLKGHIPVLGVNVALPIIDTVGFEKYDELMMPISLAMAEKCDAVFRIGVPSKDADEEVDIFKSKGLPIYYGLVEIPIV